MDILSQTFFKNVLSKAIGITEAQAASLSSSYSELHTVDTVGRTAMHSVIGKFLETHTLQDFTGVVVRDPVGEIHMATLAAPFASADRTKGIFVMGLDLHPDPLHGWSMKLNQVIREWIAGRRRRFQLSTVDRQSYLDPRLSNSSAEESRYWVGHKNNRDNRCSLDYNARGTGGNSDTWRILHQFLRSVIATSTFLHEAPTPYYVELVGEHMESGEDRSKMEEMLNDLPNAEIYAQQPVLAYDF